jgi:hypothetical protein
MRLRVHPRISPVPVLLVIIVSIALVEAGIGVVSFNDYFRANGLAAQIRRYSSQKETFGDQIGAVVLSPAEPRGQAEPWSHGPCTDPMCSVPDDQRPAAIHRACLREIQDAIRKHGGLSKDAEDDIYLRMPPGDYCTFIRPTVRSWFGQFQQSPVLIQGGWAMAVLTALCFSIGFGRSEPNRGWRRLALLAAVPVGAAVFIFPPFEPPGWPRAVLALVTGLATPAALLFGLRLFRWLANGFVAAA